jgi:hypothetical protein
LRFQIVVFYIINFDQVNIIAFSTLWYFEDLFTKWLNNQKSYF